MMSSSPPLSLRPIYDLSGCGVRSFPPNDVMAWQHVRQRKILSALLVSRGGWVGGGGGGGGG